MCCYCVGELHLKLISKDSALFKSVACLHIVSSYLSIVAILLFRTVGNKNIQNMNCGPFTYRLP